MKLAAAPHVIDVRDLKVLVTAGARGIGRAIAQKLAEGGARVHVTDVMPEAVEDVLATVPGLSGTVGDASVPADADKVMADVADRLGGLDVLVNNVGIAGPTGGVEALAEADIARTIDVNLRSHFHFLSRGVPLLKESSNNPSILALSSVAGRLGYGYRTPYAATKWAIVGLVKSLAIELGPHGVRANAILPGPVNGPRMDGVIADRAKTLGASFEEVREAYLQKISLRRMVDAEDVANLALFLVSPLARNISGEAISVDGHTEYL